MRNELFCRVQASSRQSDKGVCLPASALSLRHLTTLYLLICLVAFIGFLVQPEAARAQSSGVQYVYDALGRLVVTYDASGNAAAYKYDAVGNLLSIAREQSDQFSIANLNQTNGASGSAVAIYGTDFESCILPQVTFNGVAASVVQVVSANEILATVPENATTGEVVVTCNGTALNAGVYTVGSSVPSISGFTPAIGAAGTAITVSGTNFQANPADDSVYLNNTPLSISSASTSTINTSVASGATTGYITVTTAAGTAKSIQHFFVPPSPTTSSNVVTGAMNIGNTFTATTNSTTPYALVAFDGTAGHWVGLRVTGYTAGSATIYILPPGGGTANAVGTLSVGSDSTYYLPPVELPTTGTYTIFVDPPSGSSGGSMTLQLWDASDLSLGVPTDSYSSTVLGDSPLMYWRLDDNPKLTAVNAAPAVQYGVPGPTSPDTAISLNGYSSYISASEAMSISSAFSVELWFKTLTTQGGTLIGFNDSPGDTPTNYDRALYMTDAGTLEFGVNNGSTISGIESPASTSYNDGLWHHAVGTYDPTANGGTLTLYVDGVQVAQATNVTDSSTWSGYWHIGWTAYDSNWPNTPNSYYFHGSEGEVAVWNGTALTSTQVAAHYAAAGGGSYDSTVLGDHPSAYWELDDFDSPVTDSSGGSNVGIVFSGANDNGFYAGSPTSVPGAISDDNATQFNSSSYDKVGTPMILPNFQKGSFSEEIWFKTTTTSGGVLMGFNNLVNNTPTAWDRTLYMKNNGHLEFCMHSSSGTVAISSPASYNDGNWHYVVAGLNNSQALTLRIDGSWAAASANGIVPSTTWPGYWRIGDNDLGSACPGIPSSLHFEGKIDEPALYDYWLGSTRTSNHYSASGR